MNTDNEKMTVATPKSFWIVAGLILIWNLFGIFNYLSSVTASAESLAAQGMTAAQIDFMLNAPSYYMAVFALAVWSGLLGAIALLLRKKWAVPIFIFSAIMVVASLILDVMAGTFEILGSAYTVIMVVVLLMAVFTVWYSRNMRARGILR